MEKLTLKIGGMTCASCSANVQKALSKLDGVTSAEVNIANEKATIEFDSEKQTKQTIEATVKSAGYYVVDKAKSIELEQINRKKEVLIQKLKLIVASVFTIPLFYIAMAPMIKFVTLPYPNFLRPEQNAALFALVQVALVIPVILAGYKFYTNGFSSLVKLHPNMDSLVAVSTTAAFLYSIYSTIQILLGDTHGAHRLYFESVGVIIALILLGKFLEARSKGKTGESIRALMSLAPKIAYVIRDGIELEISVDDVKIGDTVIIKPGQSLPVDGVIVAGETSIDESMLTGESMPVDKHIGDKVFAATINKNGSVSYLAERIGEDTTLSKIISLVEEAAGSKAPIAHLADVISGWFTPVVMVIALVCALAWLIVKQDIEFALTIFISILVIACPCALGLATPTAIIVGTGKGASLGVLFKNAAALQATHKLH
ncbi:MAG: heavy metal translocating P-type ATPase, partial [Oscillospiraceae bacterium]